MKSVTTVAKTEAPADAKTWIVNPNLRVLPVTDDEVIIVHGMRSPLNHHLVDEKLTGVLAKALSRFESPVAPETVLSEFSAHRDDLAPLFADLQEAGILVPAGLETISAFYRVQTGRDSTLAAKKVAILGAGPLGARIAASLARVRVGEVRLVDGRPAPSEEIVRSYMPFPGERNGHHDIADVVKAGLDEVGLGRSVTVRKAALTAEEEVRNAVDGADFIVVALDRYQPLALQIVNRVSLAKKKPFLLVLADGSLAMVGPMFVPPRTSCYLCFEHHYEAALMIHPPHKAYKTLIGTEEPTGFIGPPPVPPILDTLAGLAAYHATQFLLRGVSALENRVNVHDFERLIVDLQDVFRLPRCPACRHRPTEVSPA
ncbi:MAG: TOMM precursor leader peptide-binding protein [Methanobacteriota archaeon]